MVSAALLLPVTDAERCWNKTCATPKTAEGTAKPSGYIDLGGGLMQNAAHLMTGLLRGHGAEARIACEFWPPGGLAEG
jgi:hypothetical protein